MPRQVDHEQRRREVGEAALRVIAHGGVAAASVRSIAGEAGMSTSWVTHYFDGHDDVVLQAVAQLREYFESCCVGHNQGPPLGTLRAMLRASVTSLEQAMALLHLTAGPVPEAIRREVANLEKWCTGQLEELITAAVKEGLVGPVDPQTAARDLHLLVLGLRLATVADPGDWPPERLGDAVDRALTRMFPPA
ncbi:MAG: TetR/AcrR family transcriptional regulator [Actinomycetia bacterium]|nr:TetR/AcrR family transcriptional regulator [Actinomycetes bacterium]MCP3909963.1 TetR/AcrR family transcriptional regulator [Actinomycetes bacterium]MCP4085540.1 TetR/AcrR family transcriptional regulator [Actinomycetes bacterium]